MSIKLTDTQLMMLSAAAQRNDRCLVAAPNLKVAAAQKIASKLIGTGLVKEIRAKAGAPVWRRDDDVGLSYEGSESNLVQSFCATPVRIKSGYLVEGASDAAKP